MADKFSYDVFLSHNSKDKPRVRRIAERLKQEGLRVWFDDWNIKPGEIISLKVDQGLDQSRILLLCVSPSALASGWVALERSTAIHRDPSNEDRRFIPLLLADCELPDTVRRYKYLDFREETEVAFQELLTAVRPEPTETAPPSKPAPAKDSVSKTTRSKKSPEPLASMFEFERKLKGHRGWVKSVAISMDGNLAASGCDDKTVKVWDLEKGECLATFKGHTNDVRAVVFTPDGRRILSASVDGSVRIWNPRDKAKGTKLPGLSSPVWGVAALSDNVHALSGGWDNTLRLWNLDSRVCVNTFPCGTGSSNNIMSLAVTASDSRGLSGHRDGTVRLWDVETTECLGTLKGHSEMVNSIQATPDAQRAVSCSDDRTVRIWDLQTQACIATLEGHRSTPMSVAVSPDGELAATAGFQDYAVMIWDLQSGVCIEEIRNPHDQFCPMAVTFSPDGQRLLIGNGVIYEELYFLYIYRLKEVRPAKPAPPTQRYLNAKVVLLGEGTVGKTSLAHRLIDDKYVVRDRTHGMNVWPLPLPLTPDASLEREALLWDLAGQEDYRLIHQLFLEETALALLLANPQKDDPFAEAGDWLKALKTATTEREATKLLVFSQVDVGEPKLGNAKIDRLCKEHGFADWLLTSAKTGRNCSDSLSKGQPSKLKQLIASSIPWDKLPWTSTPRLLSELKNAVVAMRDQQDIRLLRFAELTQRLEQLLPGEKFGESDVRTAVKLLANHGLAHPFEFGDLVLLQPELLNGYAAAIIRAARANIDEIGCVLETDIYKTNFDFTGVERLKHRADEELLLRALVQTFLDRSLCIAEDTPKGRHLVFPSQYRRDKDIPRDPDFFVSYTFSGEWQTVWTTLVVRLWYSQEFKHRELWRNAAEFESGKGHTLGMKIDNQQGAGTATISLYFDVQVPDELKAIFIEYVHQHLAKYGCEVSRDRRYVCENCGKPVKDFDAVRKRLEDGKNFIYCQQCDEKVILIDFIEQRLTSDPVAQKILAMDEAATRELDTQALEQILIGHMMAICGEANQIFRPTSMFDYGIDGEVEFKDDNGRASGKRIYIQLKSGNSYLRTRKRDGSEVFDINNERHLDYWVSQPVDVYLVIRQTDQATNASVIRWMNVTRYLKNRVDQESRQIIFEGEKLDMEAVWKVRDQFFSPKKQSRR